MKFSEPPPGTITKICGNCLRVGVPLVWDGALGGYHCTDPRTCFAYLQERRDATRPLDFWDTPKGQWILLGIALTLLLTAGLWSPT